MSFSWPILFFIPLVVYMSYLLYWKYKVSKIFRELHKANADLNRILAEAQTQKIYIDKANETDH